MADITELILADHRRIRRLMEGLGDSARYGGGQDEACSLTLVWRRLAGVLDIHAEAEQEIWYPALFGHSHEKDAQVREAIADHDDIREAAREAALHPVASAAWSRAVIALLRLTTDHIAREERGPLAVFARRAAPELRNELGRQWAAFTAARVRDTPAGR